MSRFTSISPYRQGSVRFGNRPHGIDTTVWTYQLTAEQLERLRAGEKLDDILKDCESVKEEKDVSNKKIDLTVDEYVEMHKKGMSDAEVAQVKGITNQQLYSWKYFRKGHIKRALEQEAQQEIASTLEESETQAMSQESIVTEETQSDDDKGIEWLKREAIHAHKLLTEKEQECEEKQHMLDAVQHMLDAVLARNEELQKEVLVLESEIARLRELVQELTAKNERYCDTTFDNERELRALRMYALHKLHKDVYGA
ncbi:hypothetical protein LR68_01273 [Anoxybacillus sp. BCO1]|nr:hypothetical protein LR68_01273 [Anoxybacillus sp. BCO1]